MSRTAHPGADVETTLLFPRYGRAPVRYRAKSVDGQALEGWIDPGGVRLHYLEWGTGAAGAPPLLLLHGLGSNARYWERVVARLQPRRVVALDQRGHGLSDSPAAGYAADDLRGDILHLLAAVGLHRPVVASHSWGAIPALEVAAGAPTAVSGLAIVDGPMWPLSSRLTWEQVEELMQPPFPLHPDLAAAFAEQAGYLAGSWAADLETFVSAGLVVEAGGYRARLTAPVRLQILRGMFDQRADLLWPKVRVPVLAALADSGPPEWIDGKREAAARVLELVPAARVTWHATPHDIPLYDPGAIAAELEELCGRAAVSG